MDCRTAEPLLHGYFDNELDLVTSLEIERHLADCCGCAARFERENSLRARLSAAALRFPASAGLPEKVFASIGRSAAERRSPEPTRTSRFFWAAALAASLLVLVSLVAIVEKPATESLLAQQVRDGHVRSLMAAHLADVASSDQHTVKPWFAGKLDFSPWVGDLSDEGFPLVGGRLDYFDNHPVAALVFKRREHVINLFIWPSAHDRPLPAHLVRENGYQLVHWRDAAMNYWATSDLNADELQDFARQIESRASDLRTRVRGQTL